MKSNPRKGYRPTKEVQVLLGPMMCPRSWPSLMAFIQDWVVIVGLSAMSWFVFEAFGLSAISVAGYVLAAGLICTRQRGLENLVHEGMHYHLSRSRAFNDTIAWCLGALPLGHNVLIERQVHFQHHGKFWDPEDDPDFARYKELGLDRLASSRPAAFLVVLCRAFPKYLVGTSTAFFFPPGEAHVVRGFRIGVWVFIGTLSIFFGFWHLLVLYWLLPFGLLLPPLRLLAEASEHTALGCSTEFATTRNNLGWVQETLIHPHGDGYHLVHHLFPGIPFYNLAKAHRILLRDLEYASQGRHCHGLFNLAQHRSRTTDQDLLEQSGRSVS